MKTMPYRAVTASGEQFDINFTLHPETVSPMRVTQLVTAILDAVERDIGLIGETSNGDVLQALAMATAIRSRMIHAPVPTTERITRTLIEEALQATGRAAHQAPTSGTA
jgi:hypothetical protein